MDKLFGLRRGLILCMALVAALLASQPAIGQGLPGFWSLGSFDFAGARIVPEFQIGYQKIALNFNLPAAQPPFLTIPQPATLDLQLRDANFWVGAASLTCDFPSGFSLSVKGQANAKRNVTVFNSEDWYSRGPSVAWTGNQAEWWTLEAQGLYRATAACSLLVGLRRDNLSVNLRDPRDNEGAALNYNDSGVIPFPYTRAERYRSDLVSTLWIPYVGLEQRGSGYKASLIVSPFVAAQIKVPEALLFDLTTFSFLGALEYRTAESLLYKVNKPAVFVEGNLEHEWFVANGLKVGAWARGSWLNLRGAGNWSYHYSGQDLLNGVPFASGEESLGQNNRATYNRYLFSGGFSTEWIF